MGKGSGLQLGIHSQESTKSCILIGNFCLGFITNVVEIQGNIDQIKFKADNGQTYIFEKFC